MDDDTFGSELLALVTELDEWSLRRHGWGASPRLYAVDERRRFRRLASGDPYRMLVNAAVPDGAIAMGLTVEGWAGPTDADGQMTHRPSRHPERRRIRNTSLIGGPQLVAQFMRYQDGGEPLSLVGEAAGGIPVALCALWLSRSVSVTP